jgi:hypothetical protein
MNKYMLQWRRKHAYEKLKDALDCNVLRVEILGNKEKYRLYKIKYITRDEVRKKALVNIMTIEGIPNTHPINQRDTETEENLRRGGVSM